VCKHENAEPVIGDRISTATTATQQWLLTRLSNNYNSVW
jgi:hypothetical protein